MLSLHPTTNEIPYLMLSTHKKGLGVGEGGVSGNGQNKTTQLLPLQEKHKKVQNYGTNNNKKKKRKKPAHLAYCLTTSCRARGKKCIV
jgi:hypothetical protein